ncbi:MAG TPA: hypothetical protein VD862_01980 [Candidatus Paceibacterota bacterium]|nr:hypothetical protein [Candidatus Paceibacterota bacterium]
MPDVACSFSDVVSLRDLDPERIVQVHVMSREYLIALLSGISLEGAPDTHPYRGCTVEMMQMDPRDLAIGQTFVQRAKYQELLERFGSILGNGFCTRSGIAQCGPLIVFGYDGSGVPCVAHYVPPIIEATGNRRFLIDGIHRNYVVRSVGGTIESVLIRDVSIPLPCDPVLWDEVRIVDEKPPRPDRFRNLRRELFRNTKFAGIDG